MMERSGGLTGHGGGSDLDRKGLSRANDRLQDVGEPLSGAFEDLGEPATWRMKKQQVGCSKNKEWDFFASLMNSVMLGFVVQSYDSISFRGFWKSEIFQGQGGRFSTETLAKQY